MEQNIKTCPFCSEIILADAIKCKHCGEIIDPVLRASQPSQNARQRKWIPGVAAVLSLVIPGSGQMYKGKIGTGIFWFILVIIGYCCFVIPGIILHIVCIVTAASGDPYKE